LTFCHTQTETVRSRCRVRLACFCLTLVGGTLSALGTPVEQLTNPGLESPYLTVNSSNSYGIVSGSFPGGWLDNSRYTGRHTDNVYTQEASGTVAGSAFRATASVLSGYSSGANLELYQNFYVVAQRTYAARVWLKSSANVTVTFGIRMIASPFSQRATTNCQVTTAWTLFTLNLASVTNETLALEVKHSTPSITLWVDEASCKVQDGQRGWFVSPGGSDTNAGSLASPFQTLARAVTNLNVGDNLYLRGGTYRETLQLPRSGSRENPITVAAYNAEPVTLSGCDEVAGPWSPTSNGIYAASAGWTLGSGYNQVFVDGTMQHEARHPDHGSSDLLNPATASLTVSSNYTVTCSAFDGKGDLTGARFFASVGSSWSWQNALISSNKTGTLYLNPATATTTWWWPNYANKSSDTGRGFIYGLPSLLDADGEWLLQTNAPAPHTLHLRIAGGADPTGHLVELKRRNWCLDINGQNFITVSNVAFRAGAVRLSGEGLVLESCDARYLSHYLVYASGGSANGGRSEGGGIIVSGTNNVVRRCTVAETAGSGILASGTGHLLTRNHIFNTDYSASYATCMTLSGIGITASFNTLHDTGRDILQPTGKGVSVLYNDLYHAGRLCKDLGAVYAWGTNGKAPDGTVTRIAYNWVHDSTENDPLGMGIYIDNYSHNFQIDHNVVWNFGVLSTQTWSDGLRLNSPAEDLRLFHNTLFRCRNYNYSTYTPYMPGSNTPENVYWTTNNHHLFYVAQNNLYMTNSAPDLENPDARDFRPKASSAPVDPAYKTNTIAWTTTNGVINVPSNYKLAMTVKNQTFAFSEQGGVGVPVDTDGDQLPDAFVGASPDSGAYERGGTYWTAGVAGWAAEWPGVRSEQPLDLVGSTATAQGTLISSGSAPASLFLHWGLGASPEAWTNVISLGTAFTGSFQTLLINLSNLQPYTSYGYLFHATNAYGETWSDPLSFTTGSGLAVSRVWNAGGGTNLNVDTTNNWEAGAQQDFNGDSQAFFGSNGSTALVNRAISLYGITFNRNGDFTLANGSGSIALRGGGLTAAVPTASSRTYSIAEDLTLVAPQLWSVTNNGAGATTLDVSGAVSDSTVACGITKTGNGTVNLRAANTYRGVTTVSNGLIAISHPAALGSTNGGTVVRSTQGGSLQLSGTITIAEPLTLNGERANSGYSLYSSSGSNVWSGALTRIGQTRVNTAAGSTLVMTGGASGGGGLFVINSYGTFVVAEKPLLIGSDTFWADSTGLTVVSATGNIWGETILGNGTLRTDAANALPATTKLKVGLSYAPACTFNLNGFDQTVSQLLNNTTNAGVRTITSPTFATLTVNTSIETNFDGRFTGAVCLLKTGTGTLVLTGTNSSSSGGMIVSNGTLAVTTPTSLGTGTVSLCGGTLRNALEASRTLQITNLTWHAGGAFGLALLSDGSCSRTDIAGPLTRGAGETFFFDFGNSGAANRTYTLLTFGSTTFSESLFRCRNLGSGTRSVLHGTFTLTGNALTLRTFIPTATILMVK
jgi:autotransporter-associated beta strand protein